jgi:hypothetical protein
MGERRHLPAVAHGRDAEREVGVSRSKDDQGRTWRAIPPAIPRPPAVSFTTAPGVCAAAARDPKGHGDAGGVKQLG